MQIKNIINICLILQKGYRAQIDRDLYKKHMQEEILNTKNLSVLAGAVDDILYEEILDENQNRPKYRINGVRLENYSL
jgi:tRNA uridine 5-carboxymethylaminomethyl modification enzyme